MSKTSDLDDMQDIDLPDASTIDLDLDFDIGDFTLIDDEEDARYLHPKMSRSAVYTSIDYSNAKLMADRVSLEPNTRTTVIVPGSFIFGDLLEAFVLHRGLDVREMYISTLSINEENADSLKNILLFSNLERLNILLSGYFYSNYKSTIVPYMYQELDVEERFQCAFCNTHMKIALMKAADGRCFVLHGSANMRSSSSLEQFDIEESPELYDFYQAAFDGLISKYKTINHKAVKRRSVTEEWHQVRAAEAVSHSKAAKSVSKTTPQQQAAERPTST